MGDRFPTYKELKNGLQARKIAQSPHLLLLAPDWYDRNMRKFVAKLAKIWSENLRAHSKMRNRSGTHRVKR